MCSTFALSPLPHILNQAPPGAQQLARPDFLKVPHLGHVVDDLITNAATRDPIVEVLVSAPADVLASLVVGVPPPIGNIITDVATVATTIGVLVGIPVGVLVGLVANVMDKAVARVVVDVVDETCIALLTSTMGLRDIVSVHTVRDIDPGEPSNISFFCAVERTQKIPQSLRLKDSAPQNI